MLPDLLEDVAMRGVLAAAVRAEGIEAVLRHLAEIMDGEQQRFAGPVSQHDDIEAEACRLSVNAIRSALGDVTEAMADARRAHHRVR